MVIFEIFSGFKDFQSLLYSIAYNMLGENLFLRHSFSLICRSDLIVRVSCLQLDQSLFILARRVIGLYWYRQFSQTFGLHDYFSRVSHHRSLPYPFLVASLALPRCPCRPFHNLFPWQGALLCALIIHPLTSFTNPPASTVFQLSP